MFNLKLKDVSLTTSRNKPIEYTFLRGNSASRIDRAEIVFSNVNKSTI